ncbi:hypothetical protein T439DRAFT_177013 [Meredithblackwellia eburnea MCA 4105]
MYYRRKQAAKDAEESAKPMSATGEASTFVNGGGGTDGTSHGVYHENVAESHAYDEAGYPVVGGTAASGFRPPQQAFYAPVTSPPHHYPYDEPLSATSYYNLQKGTDYGGWAHQMTILEADQSYDATGSPSYVSSPATLSSAPQTIEYRNSYTSSSSSANFAQNAQLPALVSPVSGGGPSPFTAKLDEYGAPVASSTVGISKPVERLSTPGSGLDGVPSALQQGGRFPTLERPESFAPRQ